MNSLQELNTFGNTQVEFTDQRPAGLNFDRVNPVNYTINVLEGQTITLPVGINVTEVINYQTSAPTYTIDVSGATGTTVTWATVPSGCTVTNPSTGIYVISGFKTPEAWDIIKAPTFTLGNAYYGTFTIVASITYNDTNIVYWTVETIVANVDALSEPSEFIYAPATTQTVTGYPIIVDDGSNPTAPWSLTITPDKKEGVSNLTVGTVFGLTTSFNSTTKALTMAGAKALINTSLAQLSLTTTSNYNWDYNLTYVATNTTTTESDTKYQKLRSTDTTYLGYTRNARTYTPDTTTLVSDGPIISDSAYDGSGTYIMTIYSYDNTAISNMSVTSYGDWFRMQVTTPTDTVAGDRFGQETDISDDGNTLVISSPTDDIGSNTDAGSVYVYTRNSVNASWVLQAKINNPASSTTKQFGQGIALSGDGNTLAISAYNRAGSSVNLHVFKRTGTSWATQTSTGISFSPTSASTSAINVGLKVSISNDGNMIAFGIPNFTITSLANVGRVYIYTRSGTTWSLQTYIQKSTSVAGANFGSCVSLDNTGSTLIITSSGTNLLYTYTRSGTTWTELTTARFGPSSFRFVDATNSNQLTDPYAYSMGYAKISGDGTTLVVKGPAYGNIFLLVSNAWVWQKEVFLGPNPNYYYSDYRSKGLSLSDDGTIIAITNRIYTKVNGVWVYKTSLAAGGIGTVPGEGVALNSQGSVCVIGDSGVNYDTGQFSVHSKSYGVWDAGTKQFTLYGDRDQVDNLSSGFYITPTTGYTNNIDMIYSILTPRGSISVRNQAINKV